MAIIAFSTRTTASTRNASSSLFLYRIRFTLPGTKVDFDEYSYGESPKDAISRFLAHQGFKWYKYNATATKVEVRS